MDRGADCSILLQKGLDLIKQATVHDTNGNYKEAIKLYSLGLESLISVLKSEKNERIVSTIRGKIKEYMNRAEQVKAIVEQREKADGLALGLPSPPIENLPSFNMAISNKPLLVAANQIIPPPTTTTNNNNNNHVALPSPHTSFREEPSQRFPLASLMTPPVPVKMLNSSMIKIKHDQIGCSYNSLFSVYLDQAYDVILEDPYIRTPQQVGNFVRFCELLVKKGSTKNITLKTNF